MKHALEPGPVPGTRWTILKRATPAMRGSTKTRARVLCRCVCGEEAILFTVDIQQGATTGCRSKRCRARWEAAQALRPAFEAFIDAFLRRQDDPGTVDERAQS